MTQKRQPKGVPVGGQFAESTHDEASASLGEDYAARRWETDRPLYEKLRDTATNADYQETVDAIIGEISMESVLDGKHSWSEVVGKDARRTKANIAKYESHLVRVAANDPHYRARHVEMAHSNAEMKSYGRAYDQGIAIDPETEAFFETVWNDPHDLLGETQTRAERDRLTRKLRGLENGTISPSEVLATGVRGDREEVARSQLQASLDKVVRALATRGRSHPSLALNALVRERRRNAQ